MMLLHYFAKGESLVPVASGLLPHVKRSPEMALLLLLRNVTNAITKGI